MPKRICWLDDIDYHEADPELQTVYDQVLSPNGQLDNLYRGFSLSSQTILPADDLYKAVLHHDNNVLSKCFAEQIGTYVAVMAGCDYAKAHHGQNFVALSHNSDQAHQTIAALTTGRLEACGTEKEVLVLKYVRKLCLHPADTAESDIQTLRSAGWTDTEISEIVQVVAMFSYFVRVINGTGITLGNEKPGLY